MSLSSEIKARVNNQELVDLTNPLNVSGTLIDDDVLDDAIEDMKEDFKVETATTFVETDKKHIAIGWRGVIVILQQYQNPTSDDIEQRYKAWLERLSAFAQTMGREKIIPDTVAETTEDDADRTPLFTDENFDDLVPKTPD